MLPKMKAVIMTKPGDPEVLTYTEVDMPRIEHPTDVLVKIKAAGVNPGDCQNRKFGVPSYAAGEGKQRNAGGEFHSRLNSRRLCRRGPVRFTYWFRNHCSADDS